MRRGALLLAALTGGLLLGCGQARRGGPVVVTQPLVPDSLNPNARLDEYSISVLSNVFESLVNTRRDLGVSGGLADSWHNPDPETWIFRLRAGVLLHDGRTLDSGLVARSLREAVASSAPGFGVDLGAIRAIESLDPRTVVVKTHPPLAHATAFAGLRLAFESQRPDRELVGTGPYRVAALDPGVRVSLAAFDRHWDGPVQVSRLDFEAQPDPAARVRALERGAAQLAVDVPDEFLARLRNNPGLKVVQRPGLRVVFLGMRCVERAGERNALADARVRRAVAAAIDRPTLIREALGGLAQPTQQIIPAGIYGQALDVPEQPLDRSLARRLLREARVREGEPVVLDYPAGRYRGIEKVAAAVARDLGRVSLAVEVRAISSKEFLERRDARANLWLMGWLSTRDAGFSYDYLVHTRTGSFGAFNWMGYSNHDVDRELDEFRTGGAPALHRHLLQSIGRRLAADLPVLGLYQTVDVYGASREIGFEPRPDRLTLGKDLVWLGQPTLRRESDGG